MLSGLDSASQPQSILHHQLKHVHQADDALGVYTLHFVSILVLVSVAMQPGVMLPSFIHPLYSASHGTDVLYCVVCIDPLYRTTLWPGGRTVPSWGPGDALEVCHEVHGSALCSVDLSHDYCHFSQRKVTSFTRLIYNPPFQMRTQSTQLLSFAQDIKSLGTQKQMKQYIYVTKTALEQSLFFFKEYRAKASLHCLMHMVTVNKETATKNFLYSREITLVQEFL